MGGKIFLMDIKMYFVLVCKKVSVWVAHENFLADSSFKISCVRKSICSTSS